MRVVSFFKFNEFSYVSRILSFARTKREKLFHFDSLVSIFIIAAFCGHFGQHNPTFDKFGMCTELRVRVLVDKVNVNIIELANSVNTIEIRGVRSR